MPTDFIGLFAILAAARVRFVLVGGLALVLHGRHAPHTSCGVAVTLSPTFTLATSAPTASTTAENSWPWTTG